MERKPDISYKEIARLTFADGHYTQREIAASAGCSHGTVARLRDDMLSLPQRFSDRRERGATGRDSTRWNGDTCF